MVEILFADKPGFETWLSELGGTKRRIVVPTMEYLFQNYKALPTARGWSKPVDRLIHELRIGPTFKRVLRLIDFNTDEIDQDQRLLIRVFYFEQEPDQFVILSAYDKVGDLSRERQRSEIDKAFLNYELWTKQSEVF
jgi:GTP-binding protein EngB required for normal cell division